MNVKIYDFETKELTTIPVLELAPGFVCARIDGIDGEVYIDAHKVKIEGRPHRHPPFPQSYQEYFEILSDTFQEVFPMTPAEWADRFRRDMHPEREMEIWSNIGGAFRYFTKGKSWSLEKKRDYFSIILTVFTKGPDVALDTVTRRVISKDEARRIVDGALQGAGQDVRGQFLRPDKGSVEDVGQSIEGGPRC